MKYNIKINSLAKLVALVLLALLIFGVIKYLDIRKELKERYDLIKEQKELLKQYDDTIQYKDSLLDIKPDTIETIDTVYTKIIKREKCKTDTVTIPVKFSYFNRIDTYILSTGSVVRLFIIGSQTKEI